MHKVNGRTWIVSVFLLVLLGGLGFFLYEYATEAQDWASFAGSPHIYDSGVLESGMITDRGGHVLLKYEDGKHYSEDGATRVSTLHWVGDRPQNIRGTILDHYGAMMFDYDPVRGFYTHTQFQEPGQIMLTLSSKVQNTAMAAMAGRKGTVAVYNYKTGEILCAISSPSFDPDNVPGDIAVNAAYEGVYMNRFTQGRYTPGSIYKVVTAAAALETVPDIMNRSFACSGVYEYGIDQVTCERAHGSVTLKTALASSCNCAFAQIAELVGKENMKKYVDRFQLTEPLRFDGLTTARGNYNISKAAPVELAWSCIGQYTDLINPARFLTFMGAVANGGKGAEPHLVSRVLTGDRVTYEASTSYGPRILDQKTAVAVQELMHNNVQTIYGPGNFPGFQKVCGKSGTSELGGGKKSNAMFAGFILDEDYPLAFMAVIENAGYGAANCVPVLSRVLAACKEVMAS